MRTISVSLDEELNTILEKICSEKRRNESDIINEVVSKYLRIEQIKRSLQNPELVDLYKQLANEDIELAEEGISEYGHMLEEADHK